MSENDAHYAPVGPAIKHMNPLIRFAESWRSLDDRARDQVMYVLREGIHGSVDADPDALLAAEEAFAWLEDSGDEYVLYKHDLGTFLQILTEWQVDARFFRRSGASRGEWLAHNPAVDDSPEDPIGADHLAISIRAARRDLADIEALVARYEAIPDPKRADDAALGSLGTARQELKDRVR